MQILSLQKLLQIYNQIIKRKLSLIAKVDIQTPLWEWNLKCSKKLKIDNLLS